VADRTKYWAEYYQKNKEHKDALVYKWHRKMKRKLGAKGYREWKKKENEKYRKSVGKI